jgi:hypothetical protein
MGIREVGSGVTAHDDRSPLAIIQTWLREGWPHTGWPPTLVERSAASSTIDSAAPVLGAHYLAAHWQPPAEMDAVHASVDLAASGHYCEHVLVFADWYLAPPPASPSHMLRGPHAATSGDRDDTQKAVPTTAAGVVAPRDPASMTRGSEVHQSDQPWVRWSRVVRPDAARVKCHMCEWRPATMRVSQHPWLVSEAAFLCDRCGGSSGIAATAGAVSRLQAGFY